MLRQSIYSSSRRGTSVGLQFTFTLVHQTYHILPVHHSMYSHLTGIHISCYILNIINGLYHVDQNVLQSVSEQSHPPQHLDFSSSHKFLHAKCYGTGVEQDPNADQETVVEWSTGFIYRGEGEHTRNTREALQDCITPRKQGAGKALQETGAALKEMQNTNTQ